MKRFLFIGHDATRTGAPFVLLYLLRWIKENYPETEVDLLLLAGGELVDAYRGVANVSLLEPRAPAGLVAGKLHALRSRFDDEVRLGVAGLPHLTAKYDAVLGNTAVTLRLLGLFKRRGFTTVSWLHELEGALKTLGLADEFDDLAKGVDRFIVGSNAVVEMLRRSGITKPVDRAYDFSPAPAATDFDVSAVRSELGIPDDAFVAGACGTLEHRKGADLFVRVADCLKDRDDFYFVWVGRAQAASDALYAEVKEFSKAHGLSRKFKVVRSALDQHERYIAALDVFVLPSREDPFPLVCLEAAHYGKPIVCFAGAGGMPEFVGNDAGAVVPFGDVAAMAASLVSFYIDPAARMQAGNAAKRKVEKDFTADSSCEQIFDILDGLK